MIISLWSSDTFEPHFVHEMSSSSSRSKGNQGPDLLHVALKNSRLAFRTTLKCLIEYKLHNP